MRASEFVRDDEISRRMDRRMSIRSWLAPPLAHFRLIAVPLLTALLVAGVLIFAGRLLGLLMIWFV
jgi:hypothetical protein